MQWWGVIERVNLTITEGAEALFEKLAEKYVLIWFDLIWLISIQISQWRQNKDYLRSLVLLWFSLNQQSCYKLKNLLAEDSSWSPVPKASTKKG